MNLIQVMNLGVTFYPCLAINRTSCGVVCSFDKSKLRILNLKKFRGRDLSREHAEMIIFIRRCPNHHKGQAV